MTRSTNMEHVEVLRRMRNEWPLATDEGPALDAAIASLSAQQPPAQLASIPKSSPNGWLQAGGLLYRLTEGRRPQNRDEINVTMVHGSRDPAHCEARAAEILAMLQSQPPAEAQAQGGGEVAAWEAAAMTDIKMLPLPEWCHGCGESLPRDMQTYARAVAEHNVAARDAEIEALRAEVALLRVGAENERLHQRGLLDRERDRAERLAEALRIAEAALADIGDADREPGDDLEWCERRAALGLRRIRDTLHDHDQEGK